MLVCEFDLIAIPVAVARTEAPAAAVVVASSEDEVVKSLCLSSILLHDVQLLDKCHQ